jgi:chromosome segregation ATPase
MKECAQETNEIQRAYDKLIKKYDENEAALRESEKDFETLQAQFAAYRRQSDRRRSTIETMLTNWPQSA